MKQILDLIIVCVVVMVTSSCNIDEETITPIPEPMPEVEGANIVVYDYTPAPGQFIGDKTFTGFDDTITTPDAAVAYAQKRLKEQKMVSLGAFGGYIVVGVGESINNGEGNDFAILGNSFDGSSEPGIVWVMQDSNNNDIPDDIWYELEGSDSFSAETIARYEVTYYRPEAAKMDVQWTDNMGGSGVIAYLPDYHKQDYYYPEWIDEDSYTLCGRRLASRSYENNGTWKNPAFEWGYADNASEDCIDGENYFDISMAKDASGEPIALDDIDFVKIQCAVMQQCGWAGEVSTEIRGIYIK